MKIYLTAAVSFAAIIALGCGSNSDSSVNPNARSTSNASVNSANANDSGLTVSLVPLDPSQRNALAAASNAGNYGSNTNKRPLVDEPGTKPSGKPASVAAPENSSVSIAMEDSGAFVETRIFNGDPTIAKVTKTTNGKDRSAKIFLRNGKGIAVPADQIPLLNAVPLSKLRELAGLGAAPQDPATGAMTDKPRK
jgi:hypothetical protein